MTDKLTPETPKEAFVVEVCVMGREKVGPWRVEFGALEEQARDRARGWNADRPAGYTHRVVRYVPEARLAALQERLEEAERNIGERKHIDATPNDGYPSRILQAYRNDCDLRYSESTGGVVASTPFTRAMNDLQDQRAAILDRALAALAAGEET
jgi:hypothetical protein